MSFAISLLDSLNIDKILELSTSLMSQLQNDIYFSQDPQERFMKRNFSSYKVKYIKRKRMRKSLRIKNEKNFFLLTPLDHPTNIKNVWSLNSFQENADVTIDEILLEIKSKWPRNKKIKYTEDKALSFLSLNNYDLSETINYIKKIKFN